jgi:hypothetical protein
MGLATVDRGLAASYTPLDSGALPINLNATTTPALVTPDKAGQSARRFILKNKSASVEVTLAIVDRGASAPTLAALTTASGYQLAAGERITLVVDANSNLASIAASGSQALTGWVSSV